MSIDRRQDTPATEPQAIDGNIGTIVGGVFLVVFALQSLTFLA